MSRSLPEQVLADAGIMEKRRELRLKFRSPKNLGPLVHEAGK